MSARDDDADREQGFLGRWIKRKAEVREQGAAEAVARDEPASPSPENGGEDTVASNTAAQEPAFDVTTLPSVADITADTNITDFLRREVPAALRNAALRQAWAIDPAIRDYVNPAREYAYDWNIPGGVPGNGPIEAGYDALKQVAEAFSRPIDDHTFGLREDTAGEQQGTSASQSSASEPAAPVRISEVKKSEDTTENNDENIIFAQDEPLAIAQDVAAPRRRHGGASPV